MAYACPVCETPQADGRHLANHLAFTAMIHGEDHEAWLDEHAPGWEEAGEEVLAERVAGHAAETELSEVIEDPTEGQGDADGHRGAGESESHSHHRHDHREGDAREAGQQPDRPPRSEEYPSREVEETRAGFGTDPGETGGGNERDVAAILADARELTERMYDGADTTGTDGDSETNGRNSSGVESREADDDNGDGEESGGER